MFYDDFAKSMVFEISGFIHYYPQMDNTMHNINSQNDFGTSLKSDDAYCLAHSICIWW